MSDQNSAYPPPPSDWRDMRRQAKWSRRQDRRDVRWGGGGRSWIVGVILIALGAVFLAQNFGYPVPHNWWAVFLFVPAVAAFGSAWRMYRGTGGLTPPVTSMVLTGVVIAALAVIFLMGVDLGKFWPLILIVIGLGALFSGGRWQRQNRPRS